MPLNPDVSMGILKGEGKKKVVSRHFFSVPRDPCPGAAGRRRDVSRIPLD